MSVIVPLKPKVDDIKFTNDQKNAINNIIEFIAADFNPAKYIMGLSGAGGTGKTFIINYIIRHCKYSDSLITCGSPTHKACRVLSESLNGKNVDTIQSIFGFRLDLNLEDFDPSHPQFNPKATPKIDETRLLIIDEASMIPVKIVTYICNVCKENSIKLLFVGDSFQLAPVGEKKSVAFNRCFKINYLYEIVRQDEQNPIKNLLELLRYDIEHKTYRFINYVATHVGTMNYNSNNEGFCIVNGEDFLNYIDRCFGDEEYVNNIDMYRIIGYTNACVASWNNHIRNTIVRDSEKGIITKHDLIMSYETIVDEFLDIILNNSEEYIINDIVNFVDPKFSFKGFLIKFQLVHGGHITKPLFIIDHTDTFTVKMYYKTLTSLIDTAKRANGATRTNKWKEYYDFKKKYLLAANIMSKDGKILFSRDLDYGFAITSHKSQGSTYDNVFVDMRDMLFDKNNNPYTDIDDLQRRLYVACSRARKQLVIRYGT